MPLFNKSIGFLVRCLFYLQLCLQYCVSTDNSSEIVERCPNDASQDMSLVFILCALVFACLFLVVFVLAYYFWRRARELHDKMRSMAERNNKVLIEKQKELNTFKEKLVHQIMNEMKDLDPALSL